MIRAPIRLNYAVGFYALLVLSIILLFRDLSSLHANTTPSLHSEDGSETHPTPPNAAPTPTLSTKAPDRLPIRNKHLRIMAVGDSVTAGAMGTNSYREKLIHLLHHNTIEMVGSVGWGTMQPDHLNFCEAHMAQSIAETAPKIPPSVAQHRPNVILFHMGTNDVAWKRDVDTLPDRIETLIDRILDVAPDAALLVALIIPCAFRIDEVKRFNGVLLDIVLKRRATGRKIMPVDMFAAFEFPGHPDFLADVSHPNSEGYWVMAQEWQEAMEQANALGWINDPVSVTYKRPE